MIERIMIGATAGVLIWGSTVLVGTANYAHDDAIQYRHKANYVESQGRIATAEYYRDAADDRELYRKINIGTAVACVAAAAYFSKLVIRDPYKKTSSLNLE